MKKTITIVGGGASALMLAATLDPARFSVSIYERNAAPGRKFLVAGDGGFNLTHSEPPEQFVLRYTPYSFLEAAFRHFSNVDFINWIHALGIETFAGSSGRIFPEKGIRPIEVLNAFLAKIKANEVTIFTKQIWKGFSKNGLLFEKDGEEKIVKSDFTVFCLGGASWPVTGSKGDWLGYFSEMEVPVKPFQASNCAFRINWPEAIKNKAEGKALKNIRIRCGDKTVDGEVVITEAGLEGSGIYPLSPEIRSALNDKGRTVISVDLKPALTMASLLEKLKREKSGSNYTEHVSKQLNLNPLQLLLLKQYISKEEFLNEERLVERIKDFRLTVNGLGTLEDAISTVGGISRDAVNENFELKKMPGSFVIGEMLDYDAPTGGYLLQSCFSMGKFLGDHLNSFKF